MDSKLLRLIFPPKCTLCRKLLTAEETDLCHHCRTKGPDFLKAKRNIPFIAHWTGIWYYRDTVRQSIHRFKFGNARRYAPIYARLLAVRLQKEGLDDFDCLSWVPIARLRRLKRGYDQSQLLAQALAEELGCSCIQVLKKVRSTPPQSSIVDAARRRANVLGAYRVIDPESVKGKRILLLDDVVTFGATASECAKMLMIAGAKEVNLATVAVAVHDK